MVELSRYTKQMLKTKKGYRCGTAFEHEVRKPSKIALYELNYLHNVSGLPLMNELLFGDPDCCTIDEVRHELKKNYDKDYIAVWLTTESEAEDNCIKHPMQEYELPKGTLVLEDLDTDGTLFLIPKSKTP